MLTLRNITKSFGEKRVLTDVSLTIGDGVTAALSGVSGCGKTTLLRIAAGLETPDAGEVLASGKTAVCFAEPRLFPSVRVLENITVVMRGEKKAASARAGELLAAMGLADAADLYPASLSSGMAARVSLARALAYDADIYLLDEPFRALDAETRARVMAYLRTFFAEKTVLLISHNPAEAAAMAAVFYHLADGKLTKMPHAGASEP